VERPRHPILLYTLILAMVLGWSYNFIVGKLALRVIDVWTLTSFRVTLSALLMVPIYFATPRHARFNRKDLWTFAVLGFLGVVVNRGLFVVGLNYTTAGHSALIVATGPILILILARAHRLEQITLPKVLGLAFALLGIIVLVGGDRLQLHSGMWVGDLITLVGTVGFATYTVKAKKVAQQYDTISMNTFSNLAGALMILPLTVRQAARLDWAHVGWGGWLGLAYMAVVSSVLAYLIFFWALKHVSASRLAMFTYIEPPLATLLGVLILGEKMTAVLVVGGCLILAGVYLAEFGPGTRAEEAPADTAGA
jgi:drug/metabolite transporter (DMT)-like permease